MSTVRPNRPPRPLTLREAAIADAATLIFRIREGRPDAKGSEIARRLGEMTARLSGSAPEGVDPRTMFPASTGLYCRKGGRVGPEVAEAILDAARDLFAVLRFDAEQLHAH